MQRSNGAKWGMFICVLLVGVSYAISLMAVPMFMGVFMSDPAIGPNAALFMSYNSIAGTIIAFFTAAIQSKIGPKMMVILSAAVQIIGDICMICGGGVTVMLVGRFILGFGNGLIATAAPTLVSCLWRDPQQRGIPTAVWTMWIALGGIIISFLTVPLGSWQAAFIFATIFAVVALVLAIVGIRIPKAEQMEVVAGNADVHVIDAFKSPWVILCFVMILCFAFGFSLYNSYAPMYFIQYMGPEAGTALNGMGNFIGIVAGLIIGVIFRATKKHPLILVIVFVLSVIAAFTGFYFTDAMMITVTAVFFFFVFNIIVPSVFNNVQWASPDPSVIGAAFGLLAIASNGGGIPAAPVGQMILESTGGNYFMVLMPGFVLCCIGLVCAIVFYIGRSKFVAEAFATRAAQAEAGNPDAI